ncbi:MAG: aminotransferase class I/II-fold pyridoxal phosphate-dependent enzyme [Nitriliruptorales bacterium]|nr:aminotransferase class I/II-fold pyridoxal phosphate-dependent enzyme [Nitriliruptorales bacterium]
MEPRPDPPQGGFATRAVQASTGVPKVEERPSAPAIHPASTWFVEESEHIGELLTDTRDGYVYGRYDNPTNTVLHNAVAGLHNAEAAWSFASGTAAIHAVLDVLRHGGRILATDRLYGGTHALLTRLAARSGWEVDRVDLGDLGAVEEALTDEHTILYAETVANPSTTVADIGRLAALTADTHTSLVLDNTFASPYLCRPLDLGADVVVESATKYLGGHGDVVAGVVAANEAVVRSLRVHAYEYGSFLGPFDAYLVIRGIQTLHLRVSASSRNAMAVAEALERHDLIDIVRYPGLQSHPQHLLAQSQFGDRGFTGMLSFDLPSRARAAAFADACQVFGRAASLGGTHSLVLHPGSTSHRQLSDAELDRAGIAPGTVRLSVGIEDPSDLTADVKRALSVAATVAR